MPNLPLPTHLLERLRARRLRRGRHRPGRHPRTPFELRAATHRG